MKRDANGSFSAVAIVTGNPGGPGVNASGLTGVYGVSVNSAGNGVWGDNPDNTGVYCSGFCGVRGHSDGAAVRAYMAQGTTREYMASQRPAADPA